jgi:hypothetical protein
VLRLLVTANVVPSSPILVTLMTEATLSSETSVLTRFMRRNIPEDGILNTLLDYAFILILTQQMAAEFTRHYASAFRGLT